MIHPTNPAAVWAKRPDGNGFHWTVNPPVEGLPGAQESAPNPAAPKPRRKAKEA